MGEVIRISTVPFALILAHSGAVPFRWTTFKVMIQSCQAHNLWHTKTLTGSRLPSAIGCAETASGLYSDCIPAADRLQEDCTLTALGLQTDCTFDFDQALDIAFMQHNTFAMFFGTQPVVVWSQHEACGA